MLVKTERNKFYQTSHGKVCFLVLPIIFWGVNSTQGNIKQEREINDHENQKEKVLLNITQQNAFLLVTY